ncbi:ArsR/SmtB family transcription factor [Alteraurantiacibacter aquimixticola]|uniref:ArsR family transcriptional regulator n=1 Tax=Alteraurantiacibacter aquimixticola TaxID=2489173 RepID=A0A4T3F0H0_9SPHN|nr:metalloregulator ArsR/SmtB family transcription factor [Alteraurantiacibacter aquimixticola]TIX49672.1 ArsR family transcriptional regulator [Alteraurantiacibacter aquimixticola]
MSEAIVEALKAIAHPLRFRILGTLADGEHNVGEIEEASGITQPALSQQLAILRKADLVTTRREAKQVYYAIAPEELGKVTDALSAMLPEAEDQGEAATPHARRTGAAVFARLNI